MFFGRRSRHKKGSLVIPRKSLSRVARSKDQRRRLEIEEGNEDEKRVFFAQVSKRLLSCIFCRLPTKKIIHFETAFFEKNAPSATSFLAVVADESGNHSRPDCQHVATNVAHSHGLEEEEKRDVISR